jgi:hypothetical protein
MGPWPHEVRTRKFPKYVLGSCYHPANPWDKTLVFSNEMDILQPCVSTFSCSDTSMIAKE